MSSIFLLLVSIAFGACIPPLIIEQVNLMFTIFWIIIWFLLVLATVQKIHDDIYDRKRVKEIISKGIYYIGKIIDYDDDYSVTINDRPLVSVVVKFIEDAEEKEMVFTTGSSRSSRFPIGTTIYVYKYEEEYAATRKKGVVPKNYDI